MHKAQDALVRFPFIFEVDTSINPNNISLIPFKLISTFLVALLVHKKFQPS